MYNGFNIDFLKSALSNSDALLIKVGSEKSSLSEFNPTQLLLETLSLKLYIVQLHKPRKYIVQCSVTPSGCYMIILRYFSILTLRFIFYFNRV